MKKTLIITIFAALSFVFSAHAAESVKLPAPAMKGGKPLLEMINKRHSTREFGSKAVDQKTLSEILWAAWGINSQGKRTIPTARNQQNLKVFVFMENGVWLYNAKDHLLELIIDSDERKLLAQQSFVMDSPLTLVYAGSDKTNSPLHAGSSYQNVGLYAQSIGMGAVVRGLISREELKNILKLDSDEEVIISVTLGWKK